MIAPRCLEPLLIVFAFFLPPLMVSAGEKIILYPTGKSISFSASTSADFVGCNVSLSQATPAEVIARKGDLIQIRFPTDAFNGCYWDRLKGRDMKEGWVSRKEISYASDGSEEVVLSRMPRVGTKDTPAEPCPEQQDMATENQQDIKEFLFNLKAQDAGMKSEEDVEQYLQCYPHSEKGQRDYPAYRNVIDRAVDIFHANLGSGDLSINKTLFKCLLRRESGFDNEAGSHTGAVGLGQHTAINIAHISRRLSSPNSWEGKLWKSFFSEIKRTPEGKRMLQECRQTRNGDEPTFDSKEDAKCPLNSMAASAIYNLQVQQALRRSSNLKNVQWEDEMTYQLAIGATYNLGDGAASKAVDDLELDGWVNSIRKRSPNESKKKEVAGHIDALRNCMQRDNWKPMHPGDKPQCSLPSVLPEARDIPIPKPRPDK